ncbi:MAG: phospholipase D-like domain-containing protein [Bacteroidales bacterium]|nr:phospholipase D-like domain-containing protein [Bacteroidales bacterium]
MINSHFTQIKKEIIFQLKQSRKSLIIAIAWFTNKEIYNALIEQLTKGIKIDLIIADDIINFRENALNFNELIKKGCELYIYHKNLMHNKFCIIDEEILVNGSYNWTYVAEYNKENIIVIKAAGLVKAYMKEFEDIKAESNKVSSIKQYDFEKVFSENNFTELIKKDIILQSNYEIEKQNFQNAKELLEPLAELEPENNEIIDILKKYDKKHEDYLENDDELVNPRLKIIPNLGFNQNSEIENGIVFYYKKEYENALNEFAKAIKEDNENSVAYCWTATIYWRLNNPKQQIENARKAIENSKEQDINLAEAYNMLAIGYGSKLIRKDSEALTNYKKAMQIDDNYIYYWNCAVTYRDLEKLNSKETIFFRKNKINYLKTTIEKATNSMNEKIDDHVYTYRGCAYLELENYDKAESDFIQAKKFYKERKQDKDIHIRDEFTKGLREIQKIKTK